MLSVAKQITLDKSWIPYLEGVCDASADHPEVTVAAEDLIDAITSNGSVVVWDDAGGPSPLVQ